MAKLSTDTAYYKEYQTLWAGQRKAPVSELLPKSCTNAVEPASAKPAGKGAAGARAPPPEPRGAEKAKLLIEQLMQEASREAAAAKGRAGMDSVTTKCTSLQKTCPSSAKPRLPKALLDCVVSTDVYALFLPRVCVSGCFLMHMYVCTRSCRIWLA